MSGLRFECTRCGECCQVRGEYAHIYVDEQEAEDLADFLGLDAAEFTRRYTFQDEFGWTQLAVRGDACCFFDRDANACGVYPARPAQCRSFPFWPEYVRRGKWTPEAKRLCEGVGRGRRRGAGPRHRLPRDRVRLLSHRGSLRSAGQPRVKSETTSMDEGIFKILRTRRFLNQPIQQLPR